MPKKLWDDLYDVFRDHLGPRVAPFAFILLIFVVLAASAFGVGLAARGSDLGVSNRVSSILGGDGVLPTQAVIELASPTAVLRPAVKRRALPTAIVTSEVKGAAQSVVIDPVNGGAPVAGIVPITGRADGLENLTLFLLIEDLNDGRVWPFRRFVVNTDGTFRSELRVCFGYGRYRPLIVHGLSRQDDLELEAWLLGDSPTARPTADLLVAVARWQGTEFDAGPNATSSPDCHLPSAGDTPPF